MKYNAKQIVKQVLGFRYVFLSRIRVKNIVGADVYDRVRSLSFVSFPDRLSVSGIYDHGYAIEKILNVMSVRPKQYRPTDKCDILLNWQDMTENEIDTAGYIRKYHGIRSILQIKDPAIFINSACVNISKSLVGKLNESIFGYPLDVDPISFTGYAVCKSDDNATHDGEIISCPITEDKVRREKVYNVLIDNTECGFAVDFRVPFAMGFCGFFYEKKRPIANRFANKNSSVMIRKIEDEFSDDELNSIEKFFTEIGLDYGEIDVLRDNRTGKLFIVDVAKTPFGPPNGLNRRDMGRAVEMMTIALINSIAKQINLKST